MEQPIEPRQRLGRRIRSLRRQLDLSQEGLGARSGINGKYLGEVERGVKSPSFDVLAQIAAGLGMTLADLMTFEHEELDRKKLLALGHDTIEKLDTEPLRQAVKLLHALWR